METGLLKSDLRPGGVVKTIGVWELGTFLSRSRRLHAAQVDQVWKVGANYFEVWDRYD